MKKIYGIFLLIFNAFLLLVLISCSNDDLSEGKTTGEMISKEENVINVTSQDDEIEQKSKPEPANKFKLVSKWENDINQKIYQLNDVSCKTPSLIAPNYVNEDVIIFLENLKGIAKIIELNRADEKCRVLYETEGIGNLIGFEERLYWTEYDTKMNTDVKWAIKAYDLKTKKEEVIQTGASYKGTPTPTLRAGIEGINWIEYEIIEPNVISKLMKVDKNNKLTEVTSASLNEDKSINGEYLYLQQGTNEGILVYKTLFKDNQKSFDISLYNEASEPKSYIQLDKIIDFTSNDNYFIYTGEGYLRANNLNADDEEIVYQTESNLTFDSPIIFENHFIIFRYAMNDIYIGNLQSKTYFPITKKGSLLSKPIENNGLISFASRNEKNETSFYIIDVGK